MSNHLRKKLKKDEWEISIVDKDKVHYYQPGYIFLPFGMYTEEEIMKPKKKFIKNKRVNYIDAEIDLVKPKENTVLLKDGTVLTYDVLIISTGSEPVPAETEGMLGDLWYKDIFDFYTFEGATLAKSATILTPFSSSKCPNASDAFGLVKAPETGVT